MRHKTATRPKRSNTLKEILGKAPPRTPAMEMLRHVLSDHLRTAKRHNADYLCASASLQAEPGLIFNTETGHNPAFVLKQNNRI